METCLRGTGRFESREPVKGKRGVVTVRFAAKCGVWKGPKLLKTALFRSVFCQFSDKVCRSFGAVWVGLKQVTDFRLQMTVQSEKGTGKGIGDDEFATKNYAEETGFRDAVVS
jgi:hypothetical protein